MLLTALVVEGGVRDEGLDVDAANAVQQQPQIFRRQALQGVGGNHVKYAHTQRLKTE